MSRTGNYKGRPKQPKCEGCGKSLYKRMDAGPTKTSDPYAFCRNKDCRFHGDIRVASPASTGAQATATDGKKKSTRSATKKKVQQHNEPTAKTQAKGSTVERVTKEVAAAVVSEAPPPLCEKCGSTVCECLPTEPEAVTQARARIRKAIADAGPYSQNVIGLALSIVAQELGSHEVANELINEFQLTKQFGIMPVS